MTYTPKWGWKPEYKAITSANCCSESSHPPTFQDLRPKTKSHDYPSANEKLVSQLFAMEVHFDWHAGQPSQWGLSIKYGETSRLHWSDSAASHHVLCSPLLSSGWNKSHIVFFPCHSTVTVLVSLSLSRYTGLCLRTCSYKGVIHLK